MSKATFKGKTIILGYDIKDRPWGGGNQFLRSFKTYFEAKEARVVHHLEDGASIVMLINPAKGRGTFDYKALCKYKKRNPQAKIVHRINETDNAKNTFYIERLRLKTNRVSDAVVFVSQWVCDYYKERGFEASIPYTVIQNGADKKIFNTEGYIPWDGVEPLKIVTHHWSNNPMKGTDIYCIFDELLDDPWMRDKFEFIYIGRLPHGVELRNARHILALSGFELAAEIKKNHVYLTAARWESCGMHQLEGACCGLPVLFIDEGGGDVETCNNFGIIFNKQTFIPSLFKMREKYAGFLLEMRKFPFTALEMNRKYELFLQKLLSGG